MTPSVGYTEMKESGVHWMGRIPKHWGIQKAKFHFSQTNNRGNNTPILLAASQKYGVCPQSWLEGVVQVSENTDLQQFKTVHKNDFVISLRSFQGGFERSDFEGVCSPAYQVFHADASFDNNFLKYLFKNELFIDEMNSLTVGIREGRNIKYDDFANSLIFVPPLDEQSAIAAYLDTQCTKIDEIIAEAKASIEDYKQWKESIIYEAVTKGLDPNAEMKDSGIEWIGEIPKGWNIAKAGMLFKEFIRPYCKGDKPLSLSQQDGLVPTDEMKESSLKTASYDNWKRVYLDDLVLNRFKAHLGVFFASRYVGCVSFHYGVYHAIRSDVVPKYYEYLFHSPHYKSLFAQLSNGITVGLQNLSNRNFYSAYVHFPDYETQVEIVDFLEKKCSELESLIVEKRLLIDDLEAYKKSLIYEVVTGKRRVC